MNLFLTQMGNASAKLAFFMTSHSQTIFESEYDLPTIQLEEQLCTVNTGIGLIKNHFLFHLTDEVIQRTTSFGIPQFLDKLYMGLLYHKRVQMPVSPQILSIEDLSFGFIIWLVACSISCLAFLGELLHYYFKVFSSQTIGLIYFLRLLNNVLKLTK